MSLVQETWRRIIDEQTRVLEDHAGLDHARVLSVGYGGR